MAFEILLAGDPIIDKYLIGSIDQNKRFTLEKVISKDGGALNVGNNIKALIKNNPDVYFTQTHSFNLFPTAELTRIKTNTSLITEYWCTLRDLPKFYSEYDPFINYPKNNRRYGLVLSDYNKGMVNQHANHDELPLDFNFEWTLVDSRYRSLNLNFLKNTKCKIWHATGEEYQWSWAKNFDYVIWTNGPKEVWVGPTAQDSKYTQWTCLSVPDTKVTDVTGAGDTFTAAVAAFLSKTDEKITTELLAKASMFAIECCQEVIQQEYCAVTTKTI